MEQEEGFALLEIIIVIAIIALLLVGGFYFKNGLTAGTSIIQVGEDALNKAQSIKQKLENQSLMKESQSSSTLK